MVLDEALVANQEQISQRYVLVDHEKYSQIYENEEDFDQKRGKLCCKPKSKDNKTTESKLSQKSYSLEDVEKIDQTLFITM